MDAIWYGIANLFEAFFTLLKPTGFFINWFFGLFITVGVIFWLWYDAKVRKGGENFMSHPGK
jgi:hypothetical protein